jgi:hypothetical protein
VHIMSEEPEKTAAAAEVAPPPPAAAAAAAATTPGGDAAPATNGEGEGEDAPVVAQAVPGSAAAALRPAPLTVPEAMGGVVSGPTTLLRAEPKPKSFITGTRVSALASFDQTYHPADVVDVRRPAKKSSSKKPPISTTGDDDEEEDDKEEEEKEEEEEDEEPDPADVSYYVHYHGGDPVQAERSCPVARKPPV